jgi:hypothetical protein
MDHGGGRARGGGGRDNLTISWEVLVTLNPDFQADAPVPIDGNVSATLEVVGAQKLPDQAATFGYEPGQIGRAGTAPHYCDGNGAELLEVNVVGGHVSTGG